ncbi:MULTISPECIES: group II intron reverse transcriptase/maturase [Bradyrhizobium]|jgi:RNA-directed DNA polymerase|uniref:group II intron reverse transcriptase/maturase n=1 Tax=Bradyrhizobium TaxID=374 RepID=UPI0020233FB1|nr:group II intron reverse transcriptase/maturase [Bradyrhizobium denitrificans]MCL8487029.1 group II intron reverse transcriptase/maturase [Bradyrhizobium denitrificans]
MKPDAVNTAFVLDMQRKLYRWSNAAPEKGFADLFNLVCDRRTLGHAWQRLARNKGSQTPGTDGMTRHKIEQRPGGVTQFLEEIREELRTGIYKPELVRQRLIPKAGKPGRFRPLGIPTLKDRLVQMALKFVLEPIFEADFYPTSFGFRRGRSTHDALAVVQKHLHPTIHGPSPVRFVIEGDIKGCFDAIDHHLLMERARRRIGDRKVLRLVLAFLKAGILVEGTVRHPITGTPQGGVLSPLLANVYLTSLDERYGRWTPRPRERLQNAADRRHYDRKRGRPTFQIARYADDFVILVTGTADEAMAERDKLATFLMQELRMELSLEKTLITGVADGFDFLGYRIIQTTALRTRHRVGNLYIPKGKVQRLRDAIKARITTYPTGESLTQLIRELNPIILGWRTYYRHATGASREFSKLDWWLSNRVLRWLRKKHRKAAWRTLRRYRVSSETNERKLVWGEGHVRLRSFATGGTMPYPWRGIMITNGWDDSPEPRGRTHVAASWNALNHLAGLTTPAT